jgi:hypothetical protein
VKGTRYPDLVKDGCLGPVTLAVLGKALESRSYMKKVLLFMLNSEQASNYARIAERKPSMEIFMPGWVLQRCGIQEDYFA